LAIRGPADDYLFRFFWRSAISGRLELVHPLLALLLCRSCDPLGALLAPGQATQLAGTLGQRGLATGRPVAAAAGRECACVSAHRRLDLLQHESAQHGSGAEGYAAPAGRLRENIQAAFKIAAAAGEEREIR